MQRPSRAIDGTLKNAMEPTPAPSEPLPDPATTITPAPASPDTGGPTIESIHRDLALANTYRIELLRTMLALSGGLFAFTVTFRPTLTHVDQAWGMWVGWIGLAVSMGGGFVQLLGWDHYYKSYRDFDWKKRNKDGKALGKKKRDDVTEWRRWGLFFQWVGFAAGIIGIGTFSAANIANIHVTQDSRAGCTSCVGKTGDVTTPETPRGGGTTP